MGTDRNQDDLVYVMPTDVEIRSRLQAIDPSGHAEQFNLLLEKLAGREGTGTELAQVIWIWALIPGATPLPVLFPLLPGIAEALIDEPRARSAALAFLAKAPMPRTVLQRTLAREQLVPA